MAEVVSVPWSAKHELENSSKEHIAKLMSIREWEAYSEFGLLRGKRTSKVHGDHSRSGPKLLVYSEGKVGSSVECL